MKDKKNLTLEQFIGSRRWKVIVYILRTHEFEIILAKSEFGKVSLTDEGFILSKELKQKRNAVFPQFSNRSPDIFHRTHLITPAEVFEAIAKVNDSSSPNSDEIVDFIISFTMLYKKPSIKTK